MGSPYAIEMLNITKRFPGIIANDNITLQLRKGEIHALLGENGAGKSTLMSVLFGLYQPEEGVIKKDGQVVSIKDPNDANALGIGMVHQHFKLVECFTVLDNIIMGNMGLIFVPFQYIGWALIPLLLCTVFKRVNDPLRLALLSATSPREGRESLPAVVFIRLFNATFVSFLFIRRPPALRRLLFYPDH